MHRDRSLTGLRSWLVAEQLRGASSSRRWAGHGGSLVPYQLPRRFHFHARQACLYTARVSTISQASGAPPQARVIASSVHTGDGGSGPGVARTFQRLFALVLLVAWLSLARQVLVLIGSRGLLPAGEFFERAREAGLGVWDEPSLLWLAHGDGVLLLGTGLGAVLALLALAGLWPRTCFLLSAPLYLSYATACSDFTAFQWDNMLVEVALLAACLPADRPSPLAHFAFRALLFKLYFESGIAKWQSQLHDWQDGSAMGYYYETAPIPAALAWYAHHLPQTWHRLESWGALGLELGVPLLIFAPRPLRLCAFFAFSGFQLVNTATANYGFFTYLSLALNVFLLSDGDIARGVAWVRRAVPWRARVAAATTTTTTTTTATTTTTTTTTAVSRLRRGTGVAALGLWLCASAIAALIAFAGSPEVENALRDVYGLYAPLRFANVYHLFGHITRERIEPQFETLLSGRFQEHDLWFKPGDPKRAPPYVAPHQPRVDFRLWFYGLGFRQGMPRYVDRLLDRMCRDPEAVQPLFAQPLPRAPEAVRIVFYRYRFSSVQERAQHGVYWTRERLGALPARNCR
jgi:hypothetical protein